MAAPSAFLLDLDGVFYVGDRLVPGGNETLTELRRRGLPFRFVTNTTTKTAAQLLGKLAAIGLDARPAEVFTAVTATRDFLRTQGTPSCFPLVHEAVQREFAEFPLDQNRPDFVIVGDIGERWSYQLLDDAFNMLMRGSQLVCMHKNKFWQVDEGLKLDIGAFVSGLEYASGKTARILGKPSADFFALALESMGTRPSDVLLIGDDVDSDVGGAQSYGIRGALVKTGKYRAEYVEKSSILPDFILPSIADLPALLDGLGKPPSRRPAAAPGPQHS